jgi:hypothetical protein
MNKDLEILKMILLAEAEEDEQPEGEQPEEDAQQVDEVPEEKPKPGTFEADPMSFILKKYVSLNSIMSELMTPSFKEYVEAIFIVAPKPTTFKVVLHNGQYFFLTYLGKAYQSTIAGRNYYLTEIGEKERCMIAISQLLRFGSPLKTKGPEGAEQGTRDVENTGMEGDWAANGGAGGAGGGAPDEGGEVDTTADTGGDEGGEELTEFYTRLIKKTLLTEEEKEQKKSVLFEAALVIAWYKINKKKLPVGAVSPSEQALIAKKYPELIGLAEKALIKTELTGGSGAKSTGKLSEPLTDFWKEYKATNKTSKSDVIIGNTRISVKAGPSQLMSGVGAEATATFYAALESAPELLETPEVEEILTSIGKFAKGRTVGNVRQALKKGEDKKLMAANKANKKAMDLLQTFFDTNPIFAQAFAIEAMSGAYKFGSDSPACAEYILYVDANYENAKLSKIQSKVYAKKIASQMKVDVRFKTGSIKSKGEKTGEYGYSAVLGIQSDPGKISEGVKEFFANTWNKIKRSVSSLVNFFIGNPENVDVEVEDDNIDFS